MWQTLLSNNPYSSELTTAAFEKKNYRTIHTAPNHLSLGTSDKILARIYFCNGFLAVTNNFLGSLKSEVAYITNGTYIWHTTPSIDVTNKFHIVELELIKATEGRKNSKWTSQQVQEWNNFSVSHHHELRYSRFSILLPQTENCTTWKKRWIKTHFKFIRDYNIRLKLFGIGREDDWVN